MLFETHSGWKVAATGITVLALLFGGTASIAQESCDSVKACAEQMVKLANDLKDENTLLMNRIIELEKQVTELQAANYVRTDKLAEESDRLGFVKYDSPVSIRDHNQPSVVVTRHGAGGNYLSPYPEGHGGLGPQASILWVIRRN